MTPERRPRDIHRWDACTVRADVGQGLMKPISDIGDPRLVKALAHPLRVQILSVLEDRVASPSDIATELAVPLGNVSYHVRTLADLGLLTLVKRRTRRGAVEHYYQALARPQVSERAWAQVPDIVKRSIVGAALEQAVQHAAAAAANGGFDGDGAQLARTSHSLDRQGLTEAAGALARMQKEVEQIERRCAKRVKAAGEAPARVGLVTMLFDAGSG
jgi:DNA-binding transcriptional ArsR family regulator